MRPVDADILLKQIAELEKEALEQVAKCGPLADVSPGDWHRWSAILQERTAFKYDLLDAPVVEPIVTEADVIEYCRKRCLVVITSELFNRLKEYYDYGGSR